MGEDYKKEDVLENEAEIVERAIYQEIKPLIPLCVTRKIGNVDK